MKGFDLFKDGLAAPIILGTDTPLTKITEIFANDVKIVTGISPSVLSTIPKDSKNIILVGIVGQSKYLECFEELTSKIKGKVECYRIFDTKDVFHEGQRVLVVAGSDKRGAIYGLFHISEIMGVSPWYFWADATVKKQSEVIIPDEALVTSKEPSVRYRGFFINDEQPCLGEWLKEKYGSIRPGPEAYEKIFELLLRLKGNYLWPAMWRSDFTLDHIENAELANEMGVIMGASHHEPCCRSGQEFQTLKGDNPQYGTDWSFLSNADGITEFWKDGLIRNKDFENLITIGMRGENDSYLMSEDATLKDNIDVLKKAILKQKELISTYAPSEHPQLLALYKEVEDYYYGDENTEGLKDWDVLNNDIMMLCDDNFGNVRTLPDENLRKKSGGFGMYYHFDYFGEPVSYLWINSSPLTKVWEQMTMAYDYGVRAAWIVNVGDIKNQELPLSYFLDLAYDFEKWGTNGINKTVTYTQNWVKSLGFSEDIATSAARLITDYVNLNAKRKPEALSPDTYHPVHENEATEMLYRIYDMTEDARLLYDKVKGSKLEECFYQLVYYPVMAVAEINKMQLYGSLNKLYIKQRKKKANTYAGLIVESIEKERALTREYHSRNSGKWNHMQSVYHIGFTHWNDEECEYPVSQYLNPVQDSRLLVSVGDDVTGSHRWTRHVLEANLCFESNDTTTFEVANGGEDELEYRIDWDADWLQVIDAKEEEKVPKNESLYLDEARKYLIKIDKDKWDGNSDAMIRIYGDSCEVVADESENSGSITMSEIKVNVTTLDLSDVSEECFLEGDGCISIEASHFSKSEITAKGGYKEIECFGKTLSGMKPFPQTIRFDSVAEAPSLTYRIFAVDEGSYALNIYTAPSNPVIYQGKLELGVVVDESECIIVNTIPDNGFEPWKSNSWRKGVLDQIHIGTCQVDLKKGLNEIKLFAMDSAVVIEKLVLWNPNVTIRESYLGPVESKIYKG